MDGGGATVVMGWRLSVPLVKDRDFRVVVGIGGVALVVIVIVLAASKVCVVFVLLCDAVHFKKVHHPC